MTLDGIHFLTLLYSLHMRNVCVPGDIDRNEWRETVAFFLEMKEEEAEMHKQQAEWSSSMKNERAKRLEQLRAEVVARRLIKQNTMPVEEGSDGVVDFAQPLIKDNRMTVEEGSDGVVDVAKPLIKKDMMIVEEGDSDENPIDF